MTDFRIIVMGVSGCGKSTVGAMLAEALGCRFFDGDDLHSQANKAKMASGVPLNDDDRWPWLASVATELATPQAPRLPDASGGTVIACSALKRKYREAILSEAPGTRFLHLKGTRELLLERMQSRGEHFMKPAMLDSQLDVLEDLEPDEPGAEFAIDLPPAELINQMANWLKCS